MAGDQELKLLGLWASSFAMRPRIALNLKGVLGYEFLQEDLWKKSDLLLKSNPLYKKIPVLIHKGKPICESMIIVEYIDEVWATAGPSILPADPYERAIARFWAAYIDDKWVPSVRKIVRAVGGDEGTAEAAEQLIAGLQLFEEAFEKCSKGGDFFGGESVGYIDIALGSQWGWLKAVEKMGGIKLLHKENIPLLMGWAERFCSSDAVKELMPEVDKLVEFGYMIRARQNAAATN